MIDPGLKRYRDGTHRVVDPAETLARVRPLMPAMGITRIANITGLDRVGLPVALAFRPNSRNLAVSQGKGLTLDAAKASAVMETIEHFHAESIVANLEAGSCDELEGTRRLIDVERLPRAKAGLFTRSLPMLWMEGRDWLREEPVWVPYDIVSTDYTLPFPPGHGCFQSTSNGLASGNHLLEAISSGICEVVERDGLGLWHLSSAAARDVARIRLETIDDEACRAVIDRYRHAGLSVTVWDLTTDVGIPSFRSMIAEETPDPFHIGYTAQGMGAHPARSIALLRALTEAAQSRLTYIAGSRDDVFRDMYMKLRDPERARRRQRELRPGDGDRDFRSVAQFQSDTFADDVAWELGQLRGAGIDQVVVITLTKDAFRIPVVKVVIPGLEGFVFDDNYVPGERARRVTAGQAS
ncbi:MAG TPA: YcaO-like family protein [Vicinamibacterales bacterium]|nr:YcaO-like family protein [Vicinamibacterales bacterium]